MNWALNSKLAIPFSASLNINKGITSKILVMYKIKIQENTSIEDINLWSPKVGVTVIFEIYNTSSFALFGEGVAVGKLRDLELGKFKININLLQSPLSNKEKGKEAISNKFLPPILFTIFGLELLHISNSVDVMGDDLGLDLRSLIGNYIWIDVRNKKGVITSGKFVYLFSRHGYDVPLALRHPPSSKEFPSFEAFQKNITHFINELRSGNQSSKTEQNLIEWIFHCAENSIDHASKNDGGPIEGYRGIILQKLKLDFNNDVQSRTDLPEIVKNYISQRIEDGEIGREALVNVATVLDLGIGIHNSVPSNGMESNLDKLQYAFKDGVTSKNINDHERAGYGLGEAANAARHLNALLFLVSSNQIAFYDFSDEGDKQIPGQEMTFVSLGEVKKVSGTSISLVWASNPKQEDQLAMDI